MAERAIEVGDVVVLRSGGPEMTASTIMGGSVICQWFVGDEDRSSSFPRETLRIVRPVGQ